MQLRFLVAEHIIADPTDHVLSIQPLILCPASYRLLWEEFYLLALDEYAPNKPMFIIFMHKLENAFMSKLNNTLNQAA